MWIIVLIGASNQYLNMNYKIMKYIPYSFWTCQERPLVEWFDPRLPEKAQLDFLSGRYMAVYRVGHVSSHICLLQIEKYQVGPILWQSIPKTRTGARILTRFLSRKAQHFVCVYWFAMCHDT